MGDLIRYDGFNHALFITSSTYRRACLFDSQLFRRVFVRALGHARDALSFSLMGYVLMPDHFHLLLWLTATANPSVMVRSLKVRAAVRLLEILREHEAQPWCARMLNRLRLPPTLHSPASHRVWQRRFYDMNIWSRAKVREKLDYMHANPVRRRLVERPDQWAWSGYRYYHLEDQSLLAMDRFAP